MRRFDELLHQYAQAEAQAKLGFELDRVVLDRGVLDDIEATLWNEFGVEQAVLILDMAGFSHGVQAHGIVHSLSMTHRMHIAVEAPVDRYNGSIVKFEADNMFARFPSSEDAIDAAITMNHVLFGLNLLTPKKLDVHASIGGLILASSCLSMRQKYLATRSTLPANWVKTVPMLARYSSRTKQ